MLGQHLLRRYSVQRAFSTSAINLSGHNKWSKIKQKKGVMDAQKAMVYSRIARDIMLAVRTGGSPDPDKNASLAAVLKTAKAQGVPKVNVENALRKASGNKDKTNNLLTFEAMAHGTVGVIIECLTDNSTRTIHKLRELLTQHNARLAPVGFLFERRGLVRVALDKHEDLDIRIERLIDHVWTTPVEDFAQSVKADDSVEIEFICAPQYLARATEKATDPGLCRELLTSELVYCPKEPMNDPGEQLAAEITSLVDCIEENEDVLRVYTTLD